MIVELLNHFQLDELPQGIQGSFTPRNKEIETIPYLPILNKSLGKRLI